MRVILISLALILTMSCATVFDSGGKLRSISIARQVYMSDCLDCDTVELTTATHQTNAIGSVFSGFFNTITSIAGGLIPRGIKSKDN